MANDIIPVKLNAEYIGEDSASGDESHRNSNGNNSGGSNGSSGDPSDPRRQKRTYFGLNKYAWRHIIGWSTLGFIMLFSDEMVRWWIGGLLVFVFIAAIVLPFVPGFVKGLSNSPNEFRPNDDTSEIASQVEKEKVQGVVDEYKPSTLAFFTFIEPGRIKFLVRGDRFIRCIMRYRGFSFKGDLSFNTIDPDETSYWDVVPTRIDSAGTEYPNEQDTHPIPLSIRKTRMDPIWWWSRLVYEATGAVFTGIPPFQTVLTYELERLKKIQVDEGDVEFIRSKFFSDHVRSAEFQFFVQLPSAETQDLVPVKLQISLIAKVVNPYKSMYETDKSWSSRLYTATANAVSRKVRRLGYKEVVVEEPTDEILDHLSPLNEQVLREQFESIGMQVSAFELISADIADDDLAKALSDVAKAKADAEARIIRGDAEATAVEAVSAAARKYGKYGELALQIEGNVRTVDAAKDKGTSIINIGAPNPSSTIDAKTTLLRDSIEKGSSE